jgi:hypothetical protein
MEHVGGQVAIERPKDLDRAVVAVADVVSWPRVELRSGDPERICLRLPDEEVN